MHKRNGDPFWDWMEGRLPGPPSARHLGWKCLEVNPEQGTMTVEFQPKPEFLNPARGVGGGYLAAMLDETTSPAVKATLEPQQFPSAVEFKVNFIRPAPLGKLIGRARIVHRGGSIVFVEGELRTPDDQLIANCCVLIDRPGCPVHLRVQRNCEVGEQILELIGWLAEARDSDLLGRNASEHKRGPAPRSHVN